MFGARWNACVEEENVQCFSPSSALSVLPRWQRLTHPNVRGACLCVCTDLKVIVCERSMAAFLGPPIAEFAMRHPKGVRGKVLKYLFCENGTGVAPVFIIFNAGLTAVLVWLP
jgi:hypothetical protein